MTTARTTAPLSTRRNASDEELLRVYRDLKRRSPDCARTFIEMCHLAIDGAELDADLLGSLVLSYKAARQ